MRFLTVGLMLFSASAWTVEAAPTPEEVGTLAWRAWDLRFLSEAPPICNASESNIEYSIAHNYGQTGRSCVDTTYIHETEVKSISWKSPKEEYPFDICFFGTADCAPDGFLSTITNGWDVCYLFNGFKSYSVIPRGTSCVPDGNDGGDGGDGEGED